jgi:hypothetical protein
LRQLLILNVGLQTTDRDILANTPLLTEEHLKSKIVIFSFLGAVCLMAYQNCSPNSSFSAASSSINTTGQSLDQSGQIPTATATPSAQTPAEACGSSSFVAVTGVLIDSLTNQPIIHGWAGITSSPLNQPNGISASDGSFTSYLCLNSIANITFDFSATALHELFFLE